METLEKIALVFTILGAINWGLVGIFDMNLVTSIFGNMTMLTRIVYIIIAIAGLINLGIFFMHLEEK